MKAYTKPTSKSFAIRLNALMENSEMPVFNQAGGPTINESTAILAPQGNHRVK